MSKFLKYFRIVQKQLFDASLEKGHHDFDLYDWKTLDAFRLLGLMHTEITECMQIIKRHGLTDLAKKWRDKLAEELADVIIRIMDFAELHELDVAEALRKKAQFNITRPHQFGTPHSGETYADE